jgi:hypothetical protein
MSSPRPIPGSALLCKPADQASAEAKQASSLLHLGASPYQGFEDEYEAPTRVSWLIPIIRPSPFIGFLDALSALQGYK